MVQAPLKVLHYFHLESKRKNREVKPVKFSLNSSKKMSMEGGAWKAGGVIGYVSLHPLPEEGKTQGEGVATRRLVEPWTSAKSNK